jgi:hypothetical protein
MRTLNEKLDNQELTPYEFLLALAEVMGFDRMIDFIYHQ